MLKKLNQIFLIYSEFLFYHRIRRNFINHKILQIYSFEVLNYNSLRKSAFNYYLDNIILKHHNYLKK